MITRRFATFPHTDSCCWGSAWTEDLKTWSPQFCSKPHSYDTYEGGERLTFPGCGDQDGCSKGSPEFPCGCSLWRSCYVMLDENCCSWHNIVLQLNQQLTSFSSQMFTTCISHGHIVPCSKDDRSLLSAEFFPLGRWQTIRSASPESQLYVCFKLQ